jgi:acetolactate synthase-1/2/3 large subunit
MSDIRAMSDTQAMSDIQTITKGQQLIKLLESYGVDTVFGIPGVHTLELYRGLAASNIQHITPRHEQGAGFMADGYARITGKPGVCFVITGPGLTNITTAMGQALGDSIPMLIISTVNAAGTEGQGCLHAMPQQANVVKPLTVASFELNKNDSVPDTLAQVFAALNVHNGTPLGPVHLQIPLDVIGQLANDYMYKGNKGHEEGREAALKVLDSIQNAANVINQHKQIVILAGGGTVNAQAHIKQLAQVLDAPVVTTINARGLLANHALSVPASPSLEATRSLLAQADCVIALGTQMGQTDYDMYVNGQFPTLHSLIRIDINPAVIHQQELQLGNLGIHSDVSQALTHLLPLLEQKKPSTSLGEARASATRHAAFAELPEPYQHHHSFLTTITKALPEAIIVGDSTQPVYGGNCYFEPPAPKAWFNSATGFGTLGYAVPAAIGAALGRRLQHNNHPIIALTGDGGLQFCLAELATAKDFELPIIFIVWNNQGYGEIESSMLAVGVTPIGVSPMPPILDALAIAYGLKYMQLVNVNDLSNVLQQAVHHKGPMLLEINDPQIMSQLETMTTCI